jgi:spermidine/putrescine transport system permease protein
VSTVSPIRPPAQPLESVGHRPRSLYWGLQLGRALSGLSVLVLLGGVIAMSIRRYQVEDTGLNFAGPAFAFLMLVLVVLAVIAALGVRAATKTLADDTGARDRLFGLGAAAVALTVVLTIKLLNLGWTAAAVGSAAWAVLSIVSLALISTPAASAWLEGRAPVLNVIRWIRSNIIAFLGLLVMAYLYIPNLVVAAMSFNIEHGKKTTYQWYEFGFGNWQHICAPAQMCGSVVTSLWIGAVATVVATLIGTLAAFALMRHQFSGRSTTNTILFMPMATPDIVMGTSLLAFFIALGQAGHLGYVTIIIAHVTFCLSYVVVTVKARLAGFDDTLQQAAMDLYANETQTFWKVTFPLIFPGILSAALLSFSLSFDDYIITNLNAGTVSTFPIFVWGAALRGLPMQVNVIGTIMFVLAIAIVLTGELLSRSRRKA